MKKLVFFLPLLLACCMLSAQDLSGTYGYTMPLDELPKDRSAIPGGTLVLVKTEGNTYRFWLDVLTGPPGWNRGETDGTITFKNDTAGYEFSFEDDDHPCILKFKVSGKTISINSQSTSLHCGFGNGVYADGDFAWMKPQQKLDNKWLLSQYPGSAMATIKNSNIRIYKDELCQKVSGLTLPKGTVVPQIALEEEAFYTEYINAQGKLVLGWIKLSDNK